MGTTAWSALGAVAPRDLTPARLAAHHAAQWLSRAARAALAPAADDSHSNLEWDETHGALASHPIGGDRIALRIVDLTLLRLGAGGIEASFDLDGKTDAEAGRWVDDVLGIVDVSARARDVELPYDLPSHDVADGGTYDVRARAKTLAALADWFAAAHDVLEEAVKTFAAENPGPTPVRCWPHHFDIATLIRLEAGDPESARAIGVGLSPGDETYDQPYFYVNPWPHAAPHDLPDLPAPGRWHTEGFVGAVALGEDIVASTETRNAVAAFLNGAVGAGRGMLSGE